jgi:hypothetical protein
MANHLSLFLILFLPFIVFIAHMKQKPGQLVTNLDLTSIPPVCAEDLATKLAAPTSGIGAVVGQALDFSGTDACLAMGVIPSGNSGATVSLVLQLDMFNPAKASSDTKKKILQTAIDALNVSTIDKDINVGETIVKLVREKFATTNNRLRHLAEDPSAGIIDSKGNFLLGSAQGSNLAGIIGGVTAGVVCIVVFVVIVIYKRNRGILSRSGRI